MFYNIDGFLCMGISIRKMWRWCYVMYWHFIVNSLEFFGCEIPSIITDNPVRCSNITKDGPQGINYICWMQTSQFSFKDTACMVVDTNNMGLTMNISNINTIDLARKFAFTWNFGMFAGMGWFSLHRVQFWHVVSTSLFQLGQYISVCPSSLDFTIPKWASWIFMRKASLRHIGTMILFCRKMIPSTMWRIYLYWKYGLTSTGNSLHVPGHPLWIVWASWIIVGSSRQANLIWFQWCWIWWHQWFVDWVLGCLSSCGINQMWHVVRNGYTFVCYILHCNLILSKM